MAKENAYDQLYVGEEVGTLEYTVTEEAVGKFAEATGDDGDWYVKDSPFGGPIAQPTLTATDYSLLRRTKLGRVAGLHARQESEFHNPLRVGKKVTVTGKIVDKYEKRGQDYLVVEYRSVDEDGQPIVTHRLTTSVDRPKE